MALTRETIVDTALRLLDDVGLEALSLRAVGRALKVNASALYWYFHDKQALLDEMAATVSRRVHVDPPTTGEPWERGLRALAAGLRASMLAQRDGAQLLTAARPSADHLQFMNELFEAMGQADFSPTASSAAFFTVVSYVVGATLEQQRYVGTNVSEELPVATDQLALAQARAALPDWDALYSSGLELILTGLRPGPPPAD